MQNDMQNENLGGKKTDVITATAQFEKGSYKHLNYLMQNLRFKGEEIPEDIPPTEYRRYIITHMPLKSRNKPKSEWTDMDYKEKQSREARLSVASIIEKWFSENRILTNREKRIIERVRNGTDFDVPLKESGIIFEDASSLTLQFYRECEQEYRKAHPEEPNSFKDFDEMYAYEERIRKFIGTKVCKGKIVDGQYYGEPIPEDIPFTEYARYIYRNQEYEYKRKYIADITDFDKKEFEANRKRQIAANIIMSWDRSDLTEWQKKVIEDIRTGVELDDSDDSDYVKLLNLAK